MKTAQFDYNLPRNLIALYPPAKRGETRLLVVDRVTGAIQHRKYTDVAEYIEPEDVIVLNNTSVYKARVYANVQRNGKKVECLFLKRLEHGVWECLIGRAKNVESGDKLTVEQGGGVNLQVGERIGAEGIFKVALLDIEFERLFQRYGHVPLPAYIKREDTPEDERRYNTVFAHEPGSVAAPTASLNLTKETLHQLAAKGVKIAYVTLDVGWGTFAPVRTENVEDFKIHTERFSISDESAAAINNAIKSGGKVWAFGTTTTRVLESVARLNSENRYEIEPEDGETDLFIYPGYNWKVVNHLVTNFHAPKSSLIMLVASFMKYDLAMTVYQEAVDRKYKFLSYGDSMLII